MAGRVDCGVGVERQGKSRGGHFVPHAVCTLLGPTRKSWPRVVLRYNQYLTGFKFWTKVYKELCGNSKFVIEKGKCWDSLLSNLIARNQEGVWCSIIIIIVNIY